MVKKSSPGVNPNPRFGPILDSTGHLSHLLPTLEALLRASARSLKSILCAYVTETPAGISAAPLR